MANGELDSAVRGYLQSGERLKWTGAPAQGFRTSPQDLFLIPFSLLWGGFAIFWETTVMAALQAAPVFPLFGVPFVAMGLYFIFGRFVVDAWVRSRTIYAVTDRRALLLRRVFSETLNAVPLDQNVRLRTESQGRGSLEFGPAVSMFSGARSFGIWTPSLTGGVQFIGIDNVREVYRLVSPGA